MIEKHIKYPSMVKRIMVYFARAYCSGDKGSIENANRIFRRYFSKGTNFSNVTQEQIDNVVDKINDM